MKDYILSHLKDILKQPSKNLRYAYLVPGAVYSDELWGWDSYWVSYALRKSFEVFGEEELAGAGISKQVAAEHMRGCVLNFLDAQEDDGFIPVMISGGGLFEGFFRNEYAKGTPLNQHLPFLCQSALNASAFSGDYGWFDIEKLIKYMQYFETRQYDVRSGLFFWQDDVMIGIDNNPTVFYRPHRSGADIFLNSCVYLEYAALAELLERLHDGRASEAAEKAEQLRTAVNAEMWDGRDGIYYSQDIGFFKTERTVKGVALHSGLAPHWKTMPLKIRFWGCFLPMYAGLCSQEQAERMCRHLTENDDFFAEYGIRTLAKNEKMYSLVKSGNPSNWLGAIWAVANYCVYRGLVRYGKTELAEKLGSATLRLFGKALEEYGDLFESYHPDTGEPFLNRGFLSFNLLVMEMMI
ncbi:MAG: trehalase / alfa-L-rhamnosidase / mannosyl oligosaccharide glucosidase [Clostridia bacterium]|nr:trehalase / alfa-L-rhamnosidase / mannosyl oligosaccharide glucosidase [Clostridia bacterium]